MTDKKMDLGAYADEFFPEKEDRTAVLTDGTTVTFTVRRIPIGELLGIPQVAEVIGQAMRAGGEAEVEVSESAGTDQLLMIEQVIEMGMAIPEHRDAVSRLPLADKTKVFNEVFAFQQLAGGQRDSSFRNGAVEASAS